MKRAAALFVVACLVLPAAPAAACNRLVGIRLSSCDDDKPKGGGKRTKSSGKAKTADQAEWSLRDDINKERAVRGLGHLSSHGPAASLARSHARRMARDGSAYHNPSLKSSSTRAALGWPRALAENVGYGPSPGQLHTAFMRSAGHRHNILNGIYDQVGIGVVKDGRYFYAVVVFLDGARWASWGGTSGGQGRARTVRGASRVVGATARLERWHPGVHPRTGAARVAAAGPDSAPWAMMALGLGALLVPGAARLVAVARRRRPSGR